MIGRYESKNNAVYGDSHYLSKLNSELVYNLRVEYYSGNHSIRRNARELGVGITTIENAIKGVNWKHVPMPPEYYHNGYNLKKPYIPSCTKLTPEQITEIRVLYSEGKTSIIDLALAYFVNKSVIYNIVMGYTFINVPGPIVKKRYEMFRKNFRKEALC